MLAQTDRADATGLWERNWERVRDTVPPSASRPRSTRRASAGAVTELLIGADEQLLGDHLEALDALCPGTGDD